MQLYHQLLEPRLGLSGPRWTHSHAGQLVPLAGAPQFSSTDNSSSRSQTYSQNGLRLVGMRVEAI